MTTEALPVDETFAQVAEDESISRAAKGLRERNYTTHVVDTVPPRRPAASSARTPPARRR